MIQETIISQEYVLDYRKGLGAKLKEARKKGSLTVQTVADKTGLTIGTISKIENGKFPASIDTYIKLAILLNLKISLK